MVKCVVSVRQDGDAIDRNRETRLTIWNSRNPAILVFPATTTQNSTTQSTVFVLDSLLVAAHTSDTC